jgi:hypothetical protein
MRPTRITITIGCVKTACVSKMSFVRRVLMHLASSQDRAGAAKALTTTVSINHAYPIEEVL